MENISYLNKKNAYDRDNILKFDFDSPKFADFLVAFSEVLNTVALNFITDDDIIMRGMVGRALNANRLLFNFKDKFNGISKEPFANSIYRDFDNKLIVYTPSSSTYGIQFGKTKEEYTKYIANAIKKLSLIKFNYDCLIKFTNEAISEINAKFDEIRSKNNGELVFNTAYKSTEFNKKLNINNAELKFIYGYGNVHNECYKYSYLSIWLNCEKQYKISYKYNYSSKGRYETDLCKILSKLDFGDGFKNEWNAENKGPSVFNGFTVGEVYNIYCLMADKKNAIKKMDKAVKDEYITDDQGLDPLSIEIYKQMQHELANIANKLSNEQKDLHTSLCKMILDTKKKASKEMAAKNDEVIRKYKDEIKKCNKLLADRGLNATLPEEIPDELMTYGTYFGI